MANDLVIDALHAVVVASQRGKHVPVSHRAVLMTLAALADESGVVEVSGRDLALYLGLNDQTTRKITLELRGAGLLQLRRKGGGTRSNVYKVVTHGGAERDPDKSHV